MDKKMRDRETKRDRIRRITIFYYYYYFIYYFSFLTLLISNGAARCWEWSSRMPACPHSVATDGVFSWCRVCTSWLCLPWPYAHVYLRKKLKLKLNLITNERNDIDSASRMNEKAFQMIKTRGETWALENLHQHKGWEMCEIVPAGLISSKEWLCVATTSWTSYWCFPCGLVCNGIAYTFEYNTISMITFPDKSQINLALNKAHKQLSCTPMFRIKIMYRITVCVCVCVCVCVWVFLAVIPSI